VTDGMNDVKWRTNENVREQREEEKKRVGIRATLKTKNTLKKGETRKN